MSWVYISTHTHTSFRVQKENQNLLKRNRHLCKSDSRFISTGNEVNVADRRKKTYRNQIESNQSLCLKLTLFSPFWIILAFHLKFICRHYFRRVVIVVRSAEPTQNRYSFRNIVCFSHKPCNLIAKLNWCGEM